jgi:prevent-host-death family protein
MASVTIEEAMNRLDDLIEQAVPGEALVITQNDRPVAELIRLPDESARPIAGRCQGKLIVHAEDDEHLKDWAEYLP